MNSKSIDEVREFHELTGHPISNVPVIPPMSRVDFRVNFLIEELQELKKACEEGNLVEIADGLTDIRYVLDGFYLETGLADIQQELSTEVHRSNMSKFHTTEIQAQETALKLKDEGVEATPIQVNNIWVVNRDSDSKTMKPVTFSKPDLFPIIATLYDK